MQVIEIIQNLPCRITCIVLQKPFIFDTRLICTLHQRARRTDSLCVLFVCTLHQPARRTDSLCVLFVCFQLLHFFPYLSHENCSMIYHNIHVLFTLRLIIQFLNAEVVSDPSVNLSPPQNTGRWTQLCQAGSTTYKGFPCSEKHLLSISPVRRNQAQLQVSLPRLWMSVHQKNMLYNATESSSCFSLIPLLQPLHRHLSLLHFRFTYPPLSQFQLNSKIPVFLCVLC